MGRRKLRAASAGFFCRRAGGSACQKLRQALRDELIPEPFGVEEVWPAFASVRLEAAGALEARDVVEHRRERRHKCVDRPGPALGLAAVICVGVFGDGQGRDYTAAKTAAELAPVFHPDFRRKSLNRQEFAVQLPPNANSRFPPKRDSFREAVADVTRAPYPSGD